jgi:hypothetical protein
LAETELAETELAETELAETELAETELAETELAETELRWSSLRGERGELESKHFDRRPSTRIRRILGVCSATPGRCVFRSGCWCGYRYHLRPHRRGLLYAG